jgi:FKBP-type peptidyl-prolyl cis-trans isomerase SlyD
MDLSIPCIELVSTLTGPMCCRAGVWDKIIGAVKTLLSAKFVWYSEEPYSSHPGAFMTIQQAKVVTMHYHLTNAQGEVLDSSRGSEPLTYLHGVGNLIPGLEHALTGLDVGMSKTVQVEPSKGYGEYDEGLVEALPRQDLAGIEDLQVGMQLQAQSDDGHTMIVRVMDIYDDTVVVDGNHPLAGVTLTFEVDIMAVREATAEELEHGHAHDSGTHHH